MCFKVFPVKITGHSGTKENVTYAFLDSGSDASCCLESMVRELGLKEMKPTSFTMATVNCEEKRTGHEFQLNIKSLEGDAVFKRDHVLTTESIPVTRRHMATNKESDDPEIIDKQLNKREGGLVVNPLL